MSKLNSSKPKNKKLDSANACSSFTKEQSHSRTPTQEEDNRVYLAPSVSFPSFLVASL